MSVATTKVPVPRLEGQIVSEPQKDSKLNSDQQLMERVVAGERAAKKQLVMQLWQRFTIWRGI